MLICDTALNVEDGATSDTVSTNLIFKNYDK